VSVNKAVTVFSKPLVLYVEDDATDIMFCQQAADKYSHEFNFICVTTGQIAIDWLSGDGPFADRSAFPVPNVVVIDLKMAEMDGFVLLQWIRAQREFQALPVIIYCGSEEDAQRQEALRLGANDYLVKTAMGAELMALIRGYCRGKI
jgi:DNA-binding response OmpR family regulator